MTSSDRIVRSTSNAAVKAVVRLRNRRHRRATELFLVEGFREITRALEAGIEMEEIWWCPELYLGESEDSVVERATAAGARAMRAAEKPFRRMAYRDRPEGLLAVCRMFDTTLDRIESAPDGLYLVVEAIEKPGNLGTMIRTAAAAGAAGVIVADPSTDVFNPNVVRASIGTLFVLPVAVCTTEDALAWLHEHAVAIYAATPSADVPHWDADMRGGIAIVVGAEQYGLSQRWIDAADVRVKIPMPGRAIDSLNAAASAAIVLFEAVRQRLA